MTPANLLILADRVEGLSGPCRETDALIWEALNLVPEEQCKSWCKMDGRADLTRAMFVAAWAPKFTASLDAAISLLPEGAIWRKYTDQSASVYAASPYNAQAQVRYDGMGATPALQIVAANFRMLAAQAAAVEARRPKSLRAIAANQERQPS